MDAERSVVDPFIAAQRGILEKIALGFPLRGILEEIVLLIERESAGMLGSIMLVDAQGYMQHGAAPHLPAGYRQAIDGVQIGPQVGSCGTAAFSRKPVIVEDIATDPAWANYREVALEHDLRACWSTPIVTPQGDVLATFAMYYRDVRRPTRRDFECIEVATHLAYVALISERVRAMEVERERMLAAVRSGENLRAVILDSVGDPIFYLSVENDDSYRFLWVNAAFTRLYRVAQAELAGKRLEEVLPEEIRSAVLEHYAQAIRRRQVESWEMSAATRAGEWHGEITIVPLFDTEGRCTNVVGTVHDVTARRKAERERVELHAKLHQAQRIQALGTLAGGIAHDFNNILAAIGGNTRLLLDDTPTQAPQRKHLLEIQKATTRASELVRQILTFSRESKPSYEVLDPRSITGEALDLLRATLPANITIHTHFSDDTPRIKADATQFHQVLVNLVTNAAHAYENNAGDITIRLDRVDHEEAARAADHPVEPGTYLRMCVVDRGCGMDEATMKRVFEPFFTTRAPGRGTGLGLSVVHGIVEAHQGTINLSSTPKSGTAAAVYWPAVPDEENAIVPPSEPPKQGRGERIMYVDDEEPLVFLMDLMLRRMGYIVSGYTDPELALSEFTKDPMRFDVVVTDVAMPGLPGPHLAAKLREVRRDIPIIMTSGYIRDEDREAARKLQINQLVYKSDTVEQLAEALSKEIEAFRGEKH